MRLAALAVVAAVGLAAPAVGSPECPNGGNLFANCGFEVDDSGWDFTTGDTFTRSGLEAHTGLYSLEIDAEVFKSGAGASIEKCIQDVPPNTPYEYGFWFKMVADNLEASFCQMSLRATGTHESPCAGSYQGEVNLQSDVLDGTFQTIRQEFFANAAVEDFEVGFGCSNVDDFVVYVDDLFVIFDSTVFADGFEDRGGDTCNWDASVGGGC